MSVTSLARVFVVDDEIVTADTLAAILRTSGFDATAFHNPELALEAALWPHWTC
jgi:DNA-binding response OmpR family regulator